MQNQSLINFQGSNIKAFSLLEIIISIILISIILSFAIPKFKQSIDNTNLVTLKSQIALIRNSLNKEKTKSILLSNEDIITKLDDAQNDKKDEQLFSKILDFQILSTDSKTNQLGKWIKINELSYKFLVSLDKSIIFDFENQAFICKSDENICKEIE